METTLDEHGETLVVSEILNYEYIAVTSQWRTTAYHCGQSFTTAIIQKRLRPHNAFYVSFVYKYLIKSPLTLCITYIVCIALAGLGGRRPG